MKRKTSTFTRMERVTGALTAVGAAGSNPAAEIGSIMAELSPHGLVALLVQARTIRDEERRRGSRPPLMTLSLRDFVSRVQELTDGAITGLVGNKVFVAALYRLFEERGETAGCTLDDFKDRLMTAHRSGLLALERCDLPGRNDATVIKSEIKHLGGTYHVVLRKPR